jgi:hypothetical protein
MNIGSTLLIKYSWHHNHNYRFAGGGFVVPKKG